MLRMAIQQKVRIWHPSSKCWIHFCFYQCVHKLPRISGCRCNYQKYPISSPIGQSKVWKWPSVLGAFSSSLTEQRSSPVSLALSTTKMPLTNTISRCVCPLTTRDSLQTHWVPPEGCWHHHFHATLCAVLSVGQCWHASITSFLAQTPLCSATPLMSQCPLVLLQIS